MSKLRRCDSRCHNAKGDICKCWCQGRYHGHGTKKAYKIYFEDLRNGEIFPYWANFIPGRSPELEAGFNESKMPTGK